MRSEQIHVALKQGISRYEICQLVSKGVKATHRPGTRFEESIGQVLGFIGAHRASLVRVQADHVPAALNPAA